MKLRLISITAVLFISTAIILSGCDTIPSNTSLNEKESATIVLNANGAEEKQLVTCKNVVRKRLDSMGFYNASVTIDEKNKDIIIGSVEKEYVDKIVANIAKPAKLEFKDADGKIILEGSDIMDAQSQYLGGGNNLQRTGWVVELTFTPGGAKKFTEATERISKLSSKGNNYISIYLDDKELSRPFVNAKIDGDRAIIEGLDFTAESTKVDAALIRSGSLPVNLKVKETK